MKNAVWYFAILLLNVMFFSLPYAQVKIARLAAIELGRVLAFAEHIRFCANKYGLGVNFMPNTPNYDRVVEMQALNESLMKAFPDMPSDNYPWPDHERRGTKGTGWVAAPEARSLEMPDPAAEIIRIALGKASSTERSPMRGGSVAGGNSPSPLPGGRSPSPAHGLRSEMSSSSLMGTPPRPFSASPAAAAGSTRPSSATRSRFSNIVASDKSSPSSSSSGAVSQDKASRYSRLQKSLSSTRLLSDGEDLSLEVRRGAPISSERNLGQRPQSALPAGLQGSPRPRPSSAAHQQRPASGGSRYLPARLGARLGEMQGMIRASASASNSPVSNKTGFVRDMPRLHYTEIDVQAYSGQ